MTYEKIGFSSGQILKAEDLNHIEEGIILNSKQSDWNQNDETQIDYIKNKPFGITGVYYETLYNNIELSEPNDDGSFTIIDKYAKEPEEGEYVITYNGVEYNCKGVLFNQSGENAILCGNLSLMGFEDTGEPFCLMLLPSYGASNSSVYCMVIPFDGSSSVTLTVKYVQPQIKKLEEKYLPFDFSEVKDYNLQHTVINFDDNGVYFFYKPLDKPLEKDKTYTVNIGGATFECLASYEKDINSKTMMYFLGNKALASPEWEEKDTGESFVIAFCEEKLEDSIYGIIRIPEASGETTDVSIYSKSNKISHNAVDLQPDWNAVEGDSGYIANKPFGYEKNLIELLPETEIPLDGLQGALPVGTLTGEIIENEVYKIHYNGNTYESTARRIFLDGFMALALGNTVDFNGIETGEPFIIVSGDTVKLTGSDLIFNLSRYEGDEEPTSITLSIEGTATSIKKIPKEFFTTPNFEAIPHEEGHILNRTHYRIPFEPIIWDEETEGKELAILKINNITYATYVKISDTPFPLEILRQANCYEISSVEEGYEKFEPEYQESNFEIIPSIKQIDFINRTILIVEEPVNFFIQVSDSTISLNFNSPGLYVLGSSNEFKFEVKNNEIIQKLDKKYLPDDLDISGIENIATKEYVEEQITALNVENLATTEYVDNKTSSINSLASKDEIKKIKGTRVPLDNDSFETIRCLGHGGNKTLLFGNEKIIYSEDGFNWHQDIKHDFGHFTDICAFGYGNGRFVVLDGYYPNLSGFYSDNCIDWYSCSLPSYITIQRIDKIIYGDGKFIAIGDSTDLLYSEDGINWNVHHNNVYYILDVIYYKDKFILLQNNHSRKEILYSTDCTTWTKIDTGIEIPSSTEVIIHKDNKIILPSRYKTIYSDDGVNWFESSGSYPTPLSNLIVYGNEKIISFPSFNYSKYDYAVYSEDGMTWNYTFLPWSGHWGFLVYDGEKFIASEKSGPPVIIYSYDGITWYGDRTTLESRKLLDSDPATKEYVDTKEFDSLILKSENKKFQLTINDEGILSATEITE